MQRVEVGNAVHAEHNGLGVNDELLDAVLQGRLDDPGIAVGPVVAAPGDQADQVAVTLKPEAIAVVLHLVKPVRARRDAGGLGGDTELK